MNDDRKFLQKMNPESDGLFHTPSNAEEVDVKPKKGDTPRYVNSQFLAEGGMKKVFRVEDSVTGKALARAELRPQTTEVMAASFMREA